MSKSGEPVAPQPASPPHDQAIPGQRGLSDEEREALRELCAEDDLVVFPNLDWLEGKALPGDEEETTSTSNTQTNPSRDPSPESLGSTHRPQGGGTSVK